MNRVVGIILAISICSLSFATKCNAADTRTVAVTGEAEVRVVPDEVVLTVGVETKDMVLDQAIKLNDERTRNIMKTIARYKIEPKFVQTSRMEIRKSYSTYNKREFDGYMVRKSITVTVRKIEEFESILKSLLEAGANEIDGIRFRTTELRKHKDQARILAIRAAREKATMLAAELGQRIGKPKSIREEPDSYYSAHLSHSNTIHSVEEGSLSGDTFALGQIVIKARISVEFELLD